MQIKDFKSTVMTFADPGTEILFDNTQFMVSVNGDPISASIMIQSGDVYVDEGSCKEPASKWILTRLARLPLLASRLLESIPSTDHFVSPSGTLLPTLEKSLQAELIPTDDALMTTQEAIKDRSPLETMVLYITSDAGEGKTSLINELARKQADNFKNNRSDWLLVPIPLGGRHFLRFDDITVGALQNRYRFPFLYYDSFLALVKMGVIVPAFDGFEEMFVESSSGEALSAMGILVGSLDSCGAIVVAARKAYFEFENLGTQAKLFDTIRTHSVGFGKVELSRWTESQFIEYGRKRGLKNIEVVYQRVRDSLSSDHPLLTRAVLVKRLLDDVELSHSLDSLLEHLRISGADFFSVFVRKIIEREASEKWIDRSGEQQVGTPLLTVDEHCELLSQIALSMWESRVDYIKRDNLEFVTDYFGEVAQKSVYIVRQIRERIRGHALLIPSTNAAQAVEFDHDEFRLFFLGEGVARQIQLLNDKSKVGVLDSFRRGLFPKQAQQALILALMRNQKIACMRMVEFLLEICRMDSQASYTHENCSDIIIQLLDAIDGENIEIGNLAFTADALRHKKLRRLVFKDCYFSPTSLELAELDHCIFEECRFAQIRIFPSSKITDVSFEKCTVDSLSLLEEGREIFDPDQIRKHLQRQGVFYENSTVEDSDQQSDLNGSVDDEVQDMEKIVRYLMRSTHISESIIRIKLAARGQMFIDDSLPLLLKNGLFVEITNIGKGKQRRFGLAVSLQKISAALAECQGSFESFLESFNKETLFKTGKIRS
ncbi:MAG: hypothetical protein HQL81_12675 [Magnetococcales bacterium]|nr:hypothetical protein [Magnetococcales bacterium]